MACLNFENVYIKSGADYRSLYRPRRGAWGWIKGVSRSVTDYRKTIDKIINISSTLSGMTYIGVVTKIYRNM